MSELTDENRDFPQRKRVRRGPYKQYLEPDKQADVPKSTLRSREKRKRINEELSTPTLSVPTDGPQGSLIVCNKEPGKEDCGRNSFNTSTLQADAEESFEQDNDSHNNSMLSSSQKNEEEQNQGHEDYKSNSSASEPPSDFDNFTWQLGQATHEEDISGEQDFLEEDSSEEDSSEEDSSGEEDIPGEENSLGEEDSSGEGNSSVGSRGTVRDGNENCSPPCTGENCTTCDECAEAEQAWRKRKNCKWDNFVHNALSVTHFEVFLMVFHLFIRHNMTYALVEDILKMVNVIIGSPVLKTSEYIFRKLFLSNGKLFTHVYCPKCEVYLGEKEKLIQKLKDQLKDRFKEGACTITCDCGKVCHLNKLDDNFFITISIKDSLKYFMARPNLKLLSPKDRSDGFFADVMDGEMYQNVIQPEINKGKNCLTLTWNTDGAKVFRSKKKSMWPLQFFVNEVDKTERFRDKNMFLCGMWYGKGSPNMTTFLKPFRDELILLGKDGVELATSNGEKKLYHVYAPICSVDSGAKPKLARQKAHNGAFGCGFCYHNNLPVPGFAKNLLRFVVKQNGCTLTYDNRTHTSILHDMLKADELDREGKLKKSTDGSTGDHVKGMFGISALAGIPKFNLVNGYIVDYLHTLLLGVLSTLLDHIFDSKKDAASEISKIDKRLSGICPPQSMTAQTRLLSKRDDWKGKELRLFGLYYVLPCLQGLQKIPVRQYEHLRKFIIALQILLASSISEEQLQYAASLLDKFVSDYEDIYGPINMTLNVHLLTHVSTVVRSWGSLSLFSTFCFESGNGKLRSLVKGTKGVVAQICQKYLAVLTVSDLLEEREVSDKVLKFCSQVMSYSYVKKSEKIDEDTTCLGGQKVVKILPEERMAITESGFPLSPETSYVSYFNRIVHKGTIYYSRAYTKPSVFDDTCVKLADGSYAITEKFIKLAENSNLFVVIRPLRISEDDNDNLAPLISTGAHDFFCPLKLVQVKDIVSKCVLIQFEDYNFVCDLPNNYERD